MTTDIFAMPTSLVISDIVLATGVGIIAGIIPALRASRIALVIALKQE